MKTGDDADIATDEHNTADTVPSTELAVLGDQLDGLRDLFKRRLLDDRTKQQAFDRLYEELQEAKRWREGALLRPLLNEIVLLIDRIEGLLADRADESMDLIRSELLEILARRSVEPLPGSAPSFDPSIHEALATEPTQDPAREDRVLRVIRRGYSIEGGLLRPVGVVVSRLITVDNHEDERTD